MAPLISVIIPSYNHENFVEETIKSVLNQTFQDFEIIITDDGSSDNTVEKIKNFTDPRITLFVSEENKGACKVTNNCITNSKGKYIAYISSDDVWEKDKLEKQLKFIENNPQYAAVFTKAKIINENNEELKDESHPYFSVFDQDNRSREEWLRYFFFRGNCICHPSILIKKSVYDEVGLYNERLANIPDLEMWIRICLNYEIFIMDEKLIKFRIRDDEANASGNKPETHIRGRFEYKQLLNHYLKIKDVDRFLRIFPEAKKYGEPIEPVLSYFLARMAYDTKMDYRKLWALETIYNLLENKKTAEILDEKYDFSYPNFFKMSFEADAFNTYRHDTKDLKIRDLESRLYRLEYQTSKNRPLKMRLFSTFYPLYILLNKDNNGLKNALTNIRGYRAIKNKNLVDIGFYLRNNKDVRDSGMDPILHYIYHGFEEGRKPNNSFNDEYYLKTYKDVEESKLNPLIHYSLYGITEKRKINGKIKPFLNEKLPDYNKLNKTLIGEKGFLFLINDSNNELRQHFDPYYKKMFDANIFTSNFKKKQKFCENQGIKYYFFLVPDKSVVCKKFLPFSFNELTRNYNLINGLVPDFSENLDHSSFFKTDSHINFNGGKELAFNYLNYIDSSFKRKYYNKLIYEQMVKSEKFGNGDLTNEENWSYSEKDREEYLNEKILEYNHKYLEISNELIPDDFKYVGERQTEYVKNEHAFTPLKVLVLRDSSTTLLINFINLYFKELLSYWDHWQFNKELISWYKPDIIIEIRTERFLENSIGFLDQTPK